jgi:hypothetical protein
MATDINPLVAAASAAKTAWLAARATRTAYEPTWDAALNAYGLGKVKIPSPLPNPMPNLQTIGAQHSANKQAEAATWTTWRAAEAAVKAAEAAAGM